MNPNKQETQPFAIYDQELPILGTLIADICQLHVMQQEESYLN